MKNKVIKGIVVMMLLITAGSVNAQGNIAYVSRDSIVKSIPGYAAKNKQVQDLIKTYQEEIKTKREALDRKVNALLQPYNVKENETQQQILARMSSKDTAAVGMMRKEQVLINSTEQLYSDKVSSLYKEEVQPIEAKINAAFRSYAVRNKLDMIYFIEDISPALAYINKNKNVTAAIIREVIAGK